MTPPPGSSFGRAIDSLEESMIALLMGLMTLITFANVIARYLFNDNILWALEATVFLFAWLVLLGVSYCFKKSMHLGVDVVINLLPPKLSRFVALLVAGACIAYGLLLLKGSWDYWYPFTNKLAFLETEDIPMPDFLQFLADVLNEGERYEKLPRFIPYFILPFGMALLSLRFVQLAWQVFTGKTRKLIASHEAEGDLEVGTTSADRID